MRTIAIVNQKGGCGKTTSAINLAGVFAASGYKTLLVDMGPQSHCAAGLAIPEQRIDVQIGDAMAGVGTSREVDLERLLWRVSRNLDLAPSTMKLATIEAARGDLAGRADAESRLAKVLQRLGNRHDICFIDCSPAIGLLTYNALVAADEVIIPVETGFFSLQGATKQANTIRSLAKRLGAAPVYRMLATLHNPESALANELLEELKRRFPGKVVPQVIRWDQRLRESASFGQPIIEYAPDSTGAEDYRGLAQWLAENRPTMSQRRAEQQLPADGVMGDVAQDLMQQPEVVVQTTSDAGSAAACA
jgi:chromosome partitioning protein